MTNEELRARLKDATGHDHKLDRALGILVGWRPYKSEIPNLWFSPETVAKAKQRRRAILSVGQPMVLPMFTHNIEAARRIVPYGWMVQHLDIWTGCRSNAQLIQTSLNDRGEWVHKAKIHHAHVEASCDTPALALCDAAVQAHIVSARDNGRPTRGVGGVVQSLW